MPKKSLFSHSILFETCQVGSVPLLNTWYTQFARPGNNSAKRSNKKIATISRKIAMFCLPCRSVRGDSIRAGAGGWYTALVIRSVLGWIDILLKVSQDALECCCSLYAGQTKHAGRQKYPIAGNFWGGFFTLFTSWVKLVCLTRKKNGKQT